MSAQEGLHEFGLLLASLRKATGAEKAEMLEGSVREKECWRWVLDPKLTWGMKGIPTGAPLPRATRDEWKALTWERLADLLTSLQTRDLTGNTAAVAVRAVWAGLESDEAKAAWVAIIEKRASCGVSLSTIQKKYPGLISTFEVMLAAEWNEKKIDEMFDASGGWVWAQPKYDGERRIAIVKDGKCELFTREGNLDRVFANYATDIARNLDNGVYDGELYDTSSFQKLSSYTRANNKKKGEVEAIALTTDIVIVFFDHLTLTEWETRYCTRTFEDRQAVLEEMRGQSSSPYIWFARSTKVSSFAEIDALYDKYQKVGLEGLILKKPHGPYTWKRSPLWTKLKPTETVDLQIIDVLPADVQEGSGSVHELGKIVCAYDGGTVKVGPGKLTFAERQDVWRNRSEYIGKIVEVYYQNKTETSSLRSPRALRIRHDKSSTEN